MEDAKTKKFVFVITGGYTDSQLLFLMATEIEGLHIYKTIKTLSETKDGEYDALDALFVFKNGDNARADKIKAKYPEMGLLKKCGSWEVRYLDGRNFFEIKDKHVVFLSVSS